MGSPLDRLPGLWPLVCGALVLLGACGGDEPVGPGNDPDPPAGPTLDEEGTWTRLAPIPIGVINGAIAAFGDALYVTGGSADSLSGAPSALVQRYDPASNEWTRLSDLPSIMNRHAMAVFRDTLLVLGGNRSETGLAAEGDILAYDPATDSWSHWGELPFPIWDLQAVTVGDQLLVMHGNSFTNVSADSITIFSDRDTWRRAAGPGDGFGFDVTVGAISGLAYVLNSETTFQQNLWQFDPTTDTWSRVDAQPVVDVRVSGATLDGRLHILGDGQPAPKHRAFSPAGEAAWQTLTPPNTTLVDPLVVGWGGRLYSFGGYTFVDNVPTSEGYAYAPPP